LPAESISDEDMYKLLISLVATVFFTTCASDNSNNAYSGNGKKGVYTVIFECISPTESSIKFKNLIIEDFDGDGDLDILSAGNYYKREVETRRSDGRVGLLLLNDGTGKFSSVAPTISGFNAWMDAREVGILKSQNGQLLLVVNNNGPFQVFDVTSKAVDI
jgi:enediyne biosynthesis protein E4